MDIVNLNEIRADREEDCTLWTVEDMLRAMLRDIEAGKIKPTAAIINYYNEIDEKTVLKHYCAGINRSGYVAMLALAQHHALHDWEE